MEIKPTVSEEVSRVLSSRPYMLNAIEEGYANHSEVARIVGEELRRNGIKAGAEALRAAVRRYSEQRSSRHSKRSEAVRRLLQSSKLEMRTKVAVAVLAHGAQLPSIPSASVIRGPTGTTLVLAEEDLPLLHKQVRAESILSEKKGMTALAVTSSENIEVVPGVVAFLTSTLAENGINLREFMSSYRDTLIVVDGRHALKAFELLDGLLR